MNGKLIWSTNVHAEINATSFYEEGDRPRSLDAELRRFLGVALTLGQIALGDDDRFRAFKKALMNEFHTSHVKEIRRIVGVQSQGPGSATSDSHDGKAGAL